MAESRLDATGARVFDLDIQAGQTRFLDGLATRTAGVNGTFLGPTIRVRRGENVSLNVHNGLAESTSLHWHGMHVPAAMDGGPHQTVTHAGAVVRAQRAGHQRRDDGHEPRRLRRAQGIH
jgi:FtsP/CotA-like multicopper oxidase with cupredoxin domain